MTDALLRADREARERAGDARASVILEAPAGSGKTAVLTERYLRLLCTVDEAGEILAITFTRKAAAEMRARVTRALAGALPAEDPSTARLRALADAAHAHGAARGWRLLDEPEALRIQTIDAFNFALASQLPIAARAGGALTVTEAPQGLYRRAARATLLGAEGEAALAADVNLLFERLDNHWGRFEGLLALMLRQRAQWLRHVLGAPGGQLARDVNTSLESLTRARLGQALDVVPEHLRTSAAALPGVGMLGAGPEDLPRWQRLAALTLRHDGQWRAQLGAGVLKDPAFADPARCRALRDLIEALRRTAGAQELLKGIARAPAAVLAAADEEAIGALARVLARAAAELQAEFALAGEVDYAYVAGAARAALSEAGEPTELALRTGLKLRHILVDEFQDTSLAQVELLRTLTATWEEGDGRTLFVVGDPMQSIYRFRDAEVGLFLAARAGGIGRVALTPLRLARNFRARAELVQFSNELFGPLFPAADELRTGAVRYSASLPARAGSCGESAVTLRLFPGDAREEARALAARARELKAADATARIAVLVAAHAHATPIVEALAAEGVGSLGVDLVPLAERAVVRDLVQLARALLDLGDRNAWLAVLRAPWCGATLATLAALSAPEDAQLPYEALADPARLARVPAAERARLERVRAVLADALAARERASVADWLESVWVRLGASDAYPREALEDARAFFGALAASAADGRWRGAEDFGPLLEGLYSAPKAPEANPVQIMTIHRAKGLEFEHVLVPALERPLAHDERWLLRPIELADESGGSELLVAPAPPVGAEPSALDDYVRDLLRERAAHERLRLLYVAVTRARETLWLSGAPKADDAGDIRPDARSLLARLWPVLGPRFERRRGEGGVPERARVAPLRRLTDDWQPHRPEAALALHALPLAPLALEPPEFSWVGETARHVGTLVHEWLARLARRPTLPEPAELASARESLVAALARHAVPAAERAAAADQVLEAVRATLEDARGRWILSGAHREAHAELALTGLAEGRLRTLVIDRSFLDESGTRWVIDFKTSRHEGGGREAFLDSELERYQGQLRAYASLARELGPEPVRAALYFPLMRAFRELAL